MTLTFATLPEQKIERHNQPFTRIKPTQPRKRRR